MVAYLQKSEGSEGFHQIVDFLNTSHIKYALIKNPTIYVSLIEQFWQTTTARTLENRDIEITATIDGKVKIVSKASIRRHLKLEDSDGISDLPTTEIFEQETEVTQPSSPTQTHVADEAASTGVDDRHGGAATTVSGLEAGQGSGNIHKTPTMPYDSPLPRVHTLGSDEDRMQPNELIELVTKLSDRVAVLENDLKQTKKTYGAAFTKLIKRVKTLEKTIKSSKARRRAQFVVSDDEEEDSFNQGRKIAEINEDPDISLFTASEEDYTAKLDISTVNILVSTTGAKVNTAAECLVYNRMSAAKRKDKEAQRLQEQFNKEERQRIASVHEEVSTFKPEEWDNIQAQIEADEELAHRLQAQERERYSEANKAKLLDLVRERFSSIEPTDDKERALWVEMKRLFEPDTDDLLELQRYMHDPLTWRLYDTCGVHHVSTETRLDIFMLVKKDYPMTRGLPMLMLVNKLRVDQHSEMADELLRKIFILAN
ncbi:hypothetical protein Tco_1279619 [Tanacetum coccineum]